MTLSSQWEYSIFCQDSVDWKYHAWLSFLLCLYFFFCAVHIVVSGHYDLNPLHYVIGSVRMR